MVKIKAKLILLFISSSYCQSYVTAELNVTLLTKYDLHSLVLVYCYKYV